MIQDLYTRNPNDPNFRYDILSHSNPIESIITKVKMILGTRPGQVFGDINFGIGLEDLIFETRINKLQLEEQIKSQISQYISESSEYNISPKVSFGKSVNSDYCIIDILINNVKTFGVIIE